MLYTLVVFENGKRRVITDLTLDDLHGRLEDLDIRGCYTWCLVPKVVPIGPLAWLIENSGGLNDVSSRP